MIDYTNIEFPTIEKFSSNPWYTVAGIGIDGVEMLISSPNKARVLKKIPGFVLRAGINRHDNVRVYAWADSGKVLAGTLKYRKLEAIMTNALHLNAEDSYNEAERQTVFEAVTSPRSTMGIF